MRSVFFDFHEKVSIEDAPSLFGSRQIGAFLYPSCLSRKFHFSLDAQAHSLFHLLGSAELESPIRKISWI
jgi:hypothetical protein